MVLGAVKNMILSFSRFSICKHLDKDILGILLIYTLAHGAMLLNRGILWDDWVFYVLDPQSQIPAAMQAGLPFEGVYFRLLFPLSNIILFRVIVFLSYLLSALLLMDLMKTVTEIDNLSRFVLVSFFAVLPLNSARLPVIDSLYGLSYFTFFLGAWLTSKYVEKRRVILRALILLIFFFSFLNTNSLLVFYLLVVLYVLYRENKIERLTLSRIMRLSMKYADFLALPFAFWAVRNLMFVPYGLYQGYNVIDVASLVRHPTIFIRAFYNPFHQIVMRCLQVLSQGIFSLPVFVVFVVGFVLALVFLPKRTVRRCSVRHVPTMLAFGLVFFVLGSFPYLAVGKLPNPFDSLASRYELLIPLGASFIIYYGLEFVFGIMGKIVSARLHRSFSSLSTALLVSFLLAMFVTVSFVSYMEFQRDWYKQVSVIDDFRSSQVLQTHTSFLFADHADYLNMYGRGYAFYEYTSMMKYVFGDEVRYGCNVIGHAYLCDESYLNYSLWNFRNYKPIAPEYVCNIYNGGVYDGTTDDYLRILMMMYDELFNPDKFNSTAEMIVTMRCDPLVPTGSYARDLHQRPSVWPTLLSRSSAETMLPLSICTCVSNKVPSPVNTTEPSPGRISMTLPGILPM